MLREQDRFLPIANIAKIMKRAIPENGKIAKDARGKFNFHSKIYHHLIRINICKH